MADTNPQDYTRRAFISERRNLLLTSVGLFLVQYTEVVFKKINFLGNEVEIQDPDLIRILLWIFWVYFALRYYQHFREISDKGMSDVFEGKRHNLIALIARRRYEKVFVPSSNFEGMERTFRFDPIQPNFLDLGHVEIKLPATILYKLPTGGQGNEHKTEIINLHWTDMLLPNLRSFLYVLINTSVVTEYFLPFVVALLPVIFGLLNLLRARWV